MHKVAFLSIERKSVTKHGDSAESNVIYVCINKHDKRVNLTKLKNESLGKAILSFRPVKNTNLVRFIEVR